MNHLKYSSKGFSIIEIMIGIFVFALGLTSIFLMLSGSIMMTDYSRNLIIATNLASEELDLYKNIRDSNYTQIKPWNQVDPREEYREDKLFVIEGYYILENDYSGGAFPIKVKKIHIFEEGGDEYVAGMDSYRLCLDNTNHYTYNCSDPSSQETNFFRYLSVSEATYDEGGGPVVMDGAVKITVKVIWTHGGYHSTEVSTIVTDWKKL